MNREDWLADAVSELRPLFTHYGETLPLAIKVACGLPSTAKRSGAIGECWADTTSSDGSFNIFISPTLENPVQIFETLVHELCHATAGAMNHGVNFQRVADAMHLIPCGAGSAPYKATKGNLKFMDVYGSIIAALGEYPHGALTMTTRKKQGTRMMLALCPSCGFKVRLTQHWADKGLPTCGTKLPNGSGVCDTKFILA
jgi:hypothetical protein